MANLLKQRQNLSQLCKEPASSSSPETVSRQGPSTASKYVFYVNVPISTKINALWFGFRKSLALREKTHGN